ncbi:MAG TPA: BMC domain-containing protein [Paenibacillus sp.]|jgi:microcompartment protein CcmL/EutN
MRNNALGLVEVRGYLGAVAAADAALKAAGVSCIGLEVIKGGLVTVKLSGEVGAVQAAVEAGVEIAAQLDVLLTSHVIPRVHEETAAMVASPIDEDISKEQLVEITVDPPPEDVKLAAVAATLEAEAGMVKQETDRRDPSKTTDRKSKKPRPKNDTVVALEREVIQPVSQGKAKTNRSKNAKKAGL